jgi:hypothetical protein
MGAVECGQSLPAFRRHPWDLGVEDVTKLFPRRGRHAGSLFAASVMDGRDAAMIGGKSKPSKIILAAVFGVRKPLDAADDHEVGAARQKRHSPDQRRGVRRGQPLVLEGRLPVGTHVSKRGFSRLGPPAVHTRLERPWGALHGLAEANFVELEIRAVVTSSRNSWP